MIRLPEKRAAPGAANASATVQTLAVGSKLFPLG